MRAVVLVGGFGTRLRPLTLSTPKQMLPVVDRPMIEWVVAGLARHGVDEAVLSLGYRPDAFRAAYPDSVCAGVRLRYAVEPEPLDTAGAIRFAARHAGVAERFVVVNGDVLTDLDVSALLDFHERAGAEATIALHRVDDPSAFGVVPTDDDGRVAAFVEKPPPEQAPTDRINAGTYVLEPSVLDRIPAERRVSIERETFPTMVDDRMLFALDDGGCYWLDAGTPAQYLQAQLDLIDGSRGPAPLPVAADALVHPSARLDRAIVMSGAQVAEGTTLQACAVLPNASVGADAVVVGSIVGSGAVVGDGARVLDGAVLGDGVVVAAGEMVVGRRIPEPA
ncbi:MAG: sugar phosphate nucleotidyltransferase [Acidimicrobiales bacterium]